MVACMLQVGYGLVGDLAALAVRLGRHEYVATAAPALDVGTVHRALYQRRVPGIHKVGLCLWPLGALAVMASFRRLSEPAFTSSCCYMVSLISDDNHALSQLLAASFGN